MSAESIQLPSVPDLLAAGWIHDRGMFVSPYTGSLLNEGTAKYCEWSMQCINADVEKILPQPKEDSFAPTMKFHMEHNAPKQVEEATNHY